MKDEKERHMHPVVQRPAPIQIQTVNLAHTDADLVGTATSYAFLYPLYLPNFCGHRMNTPSICTSSSSSASTSTSTSTDEFFPLPPPPRYVSPSPQCTKSNGVYSLLFYLQL
jgi:hypothetical protein